MSKPVRARARAGSGRATARGFAAATALFAVLAAGACADGATPPVIDDASAARIQLSIQVSELDRGDTTRADIAVLNSSCMRIAAVHEPLEQPAARDERGCTSPMLADRCEDQRDWYGIIRNVVRFVDAFTQITESIRTIIDMAREIIVAVRPWLRATGRGRGPACREGAARIDHPDEVESRRRV